MTETAETAHRTFMICLRATPEEAEVITWKAKQCGLSRSDYLRRLGLGETVRARPSAPEREAMHQLARIGNNLNQLARHANASRKAKLSRRLEQVLTAVLDAIRRLS